MELLYKLSITLLCHFNANEIANHFQDKKVEPEVIVLKPA
jgi:hypothetical protein